MTHAAASAPPAAAKQAGDVLRSPEQRSDDELYDWVSEDGDAGAEVIVSVF